MRCARLGRWTGVYLTPRNPRAVTHELANVGAPGAQTSSQGRSLWRSRECQQVRRIHSTGTRRQAAAATGSESERAHEYPSDDVLLKPSPAQSAPTRTAIPSRRPSAKVAALHARLSLPQRFPQTALRRCLVHPSADPDPAHNNAALAILGKELIAYHAAEWLICNYPRLPMPVIFAAQYAYSGEKTLSLIRHEWGVDAADAPGGEVDTGYLQFKRVLPGNAMAEDEIHRVKDVRPPPAASGTGRPREQFHDRRGMSSRIVFDDEFGELRSGVVVPDQPQGLDIDLASSIEGAPLDSFNGPYGDGVTLDSASSQFIRAVFGALYLYAGPRACHTFHQMHIMSRHLPLHKLFHFSNPLNDLARLCDREGFTPPVARLISETGRKTRSPVFVVGVYSGRDKLGEDAGSSLLEARHRAAAHALRSWYLYSPPAEDVCLPSKQSEMEHEGKRWRPQMVDPGEIIT